MSALEAIEDRLIDLEDEKRILDARIEELERLRGELAIEGGGAEGDAPEVEAVIVKPARARVAIAAPKAERVHEPSANGTGRTRRPKAVIVKLIAEALADGPLTPGELIRRVQLGNGTFYNTIQEFGPNSPAREQCFRKGDAGWELTDHGRQTLLGKS